MSLDTILMSLSLLVICSFFYNYLLEKFQIPSVILLIATGVLLKFIAEIAGIYHPPSANALALFGTLGLITIVLEAVLDLKIAGHNYQKVLVALISATLSILLISIVVGVFIHYIYPISYRSAMIYAAPIAIISSAIVIPSISGLSPELKEFLVFESIFSDIIGILVFNLFTNVEPGNWLSFGKFSLSFVGILILSAIISIPLALILNHSKRDHQHVFILAILIFIYGLAKHFHMSALILILVFGLMLNNMSLIFSKTKYRHLFRKRDMQNELADMQNLTGEFAFIIRTFFFILFGFSINLELLFSLKALSITAGMLVIVYIIRYLSFFVFRVKNIKTATFIAPRGLITVLLFFQIPDSLKYSGFDGGVIFLMVIFTSIIMSISLIAAKTK